MEWPILSLMGIIFVGGVGTLLWKRHQARWLTLARHTMHCPLHDCQATIVVRTNSLTHPRRQYVDVTACSLHPETPVTLPERIGSVPDTSYDTLYPQAPGRYPHYPLKIPCRKNCLAILNKGADSCAIQPVCCTSEASHGPYLAQQATHNSVMTQALWFYSVSSPC